jgi:O-succinylbenzoate synthase
LGQAIELINKSVEQLGTKFPGFRIDANRSLDYTQALQLVEAIPASAVYYLEEPLRDPSGLATLYAETGVAIALDESLQLASLLPGFEELKGIAAYVIKPMLCGSLDRLSQLAGLAKKHNIELIISSVYEGALGWSQLCGLAQHYAQGKPAGLDTRGPFGDQHTGLIQPGTFTTTLRERYYPGSQQVGEWRWTGA